jgi:hypothetical protein
MWNQCISPLKLWVRFEPRSWRGGLDTTICDKVCQSLATGRLFSPGTPVSSSNKNSPPRYSWNIAKSGAKHHILKPNQTLGHMHLLPILAVMYRFFVIIFYCDKLSNKIGHKLLQLILSPLLTCTMHILYNDSKTYKTYYHIFYWNNAEFACVIKA